MVDYYIEADPTNTYLSTFVGNEQELVWLESTQTGHNPAIFYYEDAESLVFIHSVAGTVLQPYDTSGFDTGYLYVFWTPAAALGSVTISLVVTLGVGTEVARYSATNTVIEGGDATSAFLQMPTSVLVPAGGKVRGLFKHNGTPTTFTIGGELSLDYAQSPDRKWWVGSAGWE